MAKRPPERGNGKVYVIHASGTMAVKIGTANDPEKRLKDLQVGCPLELVMVTYGEGGQFLEQEAHIRLKPAHIRGEWYSLKHQSVWDLIKSIKRHGTLTCWWAKMKVAEVKAFQNRKTLNEIAYLLKALEAINGRKKRAEMVETNDPTAEGFNSPH